MREREREREREKPVERDKLRERPVDSIKYRQVRSKSYRSFEILQDRKGRDRGMTEWRKRYTRKGRQEESDTVAYLLNFVN